jgi:hypothetical protein
LAHAQPRNLVTRWANPAGSLVRPISSRADDSETSCWTRPGPKFSSSGQGREDLEAKPAGKSPKSLPPGGTRGARTISGSTSTKTTTRREADDEVDEPSEVARLGCRTNGLTAEGTRPRRPGSWRPRRDLVRFCWYRRPPPCGLRSVLSSGRSYVQHLAPDPSRPSPPRRPG